MFSVNQNGRIFLYGKSINKSSFGFSILALYKNSDHSDERKTKQAMRKECDHVSSPFWFDKQSHVTSVVNVWHQNQPSCLSLNSQSSSISTKKVQFKSKMFFGFPSAACRQRAHGLPQKALFNLVEHKY